MGRSILAAIVGVVLIAGCSSTEQGQNAEKGSKQTFSMSGPRPADANVRRECIQSSLREFGRTGMAGILGPAERGNAPLSSRDQFFSYQNCARQRGLER